ncbi:MAG: hypothetical protein P8P36_08010 [Akkermansiaceae bacterium]|nr:hypothetical protein [Akkermansiaceae bacterium]
MNNSDKQGAILCEHVIIINQYPPSATTRRKQASKAQKHHPQTA